MKQTIESERGTALVEILIVIVLSSLLIGLFLHADLAVNRSIVRWTYRSGLEQSAISVGKQLRADIVRCDSLSRPRKTELDLFQPDGATIHYAFRVGTITRNDRVMLPSPITLASFDLEPLTHKPDALLQNTAWPMGIQQLLTIVLERDGVASQTLTIPVRPYSTRYIE